VNSNKGKNSNKVIRKEVWGKEKNSKIGKWEKVYGVKTWEIIVKQNKIELEAEYLAVPFPDANRNVRFQ
jgi:hypothetical protein